MADITTEVKKGCAARQIEEAVHETGRAIWLVGERVTRPNRVVQSCSCFERETSVRKCLDHPGDHRGSREGTGNNAAHAQLHARPEGRDCLDCRKRLGNGSVPRHFEIRR